MLLYWRIGLESLSSFCFKPFVTQVAGNITLFSLCGAIYHSLSGGGYIFSTNNSGQWVNASWAAFSSTPCWGNATLTLNSKVGVVVGFREYANNSLNVWADSGLYTITTTNESSAPSPTPTSSPTPTTDPTKAPTPLNTASSSPSQTPAPTPTPTQTNLFSTETMLILASVAAVLVVLSAVAFKKGYITIKVVDEEEKSQEEDDYAI